MSADGCGAPGGDTVVQVDSPNGWAQRQLDGAVLPSERISIAIIHRLQQRLDWLERRWSVMMAMAPPGLHDAVEAAAKLVESIESRQRG